MSDPAGDPITLTEIQHRIDAFPDDAGNGYNYLDYHFSAGPAYCRARAYADTMTEVTLFGRFKDRSSTSKVPFPDFEKAVLAYLGRRFDVVERR